ncbi:hypothetical protein [Enterobacter sp. 22325]|uniref:hypothetical protein n=1 Tax=Enterobacter sp. 22325 TaxID=3453911 RepID=UPI003F84FA96
MILFQGKRRVAKLYRCLLSITACLLVFSGCYWFDSKLRDEITRYSYHGLWEQKNKTVIGAVSFDLDNNLALVKLTKKEMLPDGQVSQVNSRLIKMNLRAFLQQRLVMAHIGQQKIGSYDDLNHFGSNLMLSIATHYDNRHLTLILDSEDIFGDTSDKIVLIMSKDLWVYK